MDVAFGSLSFSAKENANAGIDPTHDYLLLCFANVHWLEYHEAWSKLRNENEEQRIFHRDQLPAEMLNAVGEVVFVDWTTETILARREFAMPQGACVDSAAGLMMVGQRRNNTIECLPMNGSPSYIISSPSLANVHSIEKLRGAENTYLVTSADTDRLFEIDREGRVLWEWCAHDHGHTQAQLGGPVDTPTTIGDYRPYTCVSGHHAVHPNSATYHYTSPCEKGEVGSDECDGVLATLFHTGEVVRIDRKTGEMSTVLKDLKHPHSVRPMPDNRGYSVCNTEKGVIKFLHPHSFEQIGCIETGHPWLMDAVVGESNEGKDGERNLRVYASCNMNIKENKAEYNNYIMEFDFDTKRLVKQVVVGRNNHLYQIGLLTPRQVEEWLPMLSK